MQVLDNKALAFLSISKYENYSHSRAPCAAANFKANMLIMRYLRLDWSTLGLHFSCILHVLHVDVSQYFARIFIFLQDIRSFCGNIHLRNKISLHPTFNIRVITQFGQQSSQHFDHFHCSCITYSGRGITPKAHSANFVCKVSDFF